MVVRVGVVVAAVLLKLSVASPVVFWLKHSIFSVMVDSCGDGDICGDVDIMVPVEVACVVTSARTVDVTFAVPRRCPPPEGMAPWWCS